MKRFMEFLEELNMEDEKRVFNGGETRPEPETRRAGVKRTPVFLNSIAVNEEVGAAGGGAAAPAPAVGGDVAPSVPHTPSGAPGGILAPGSDCMMPTVINGNVPSCGCPPHGHRPPPPSRRHYYFPRAYFVVGLGTVAKKKKKSKKRKNSKKRTPKNPY